MRNNREQRLRQNPGLLLLLAAAVVIMLYAFLAYPIYTRMKMQVLRKAYKEISVMNLAMLDEEETSILQSFNADKLEFLITDENFALVYTNKSQAVDQQIERYVRSRADEFQEEPTLTAREYNSFCVIRLRALLHADGKTYYVFIRCEVHQVHEMINYTVMYLTLALLIICAVWSLLQKKMQQRLAFVPEGAMAGQENKRAAGTHGEGADGGFGSIDEAQKEFVANISHELKTPLAVISGQVEMLQCMGSEIDREYYFSSIREEIDKMTDLVGNLLDITVMDHHMEEMEMSEVNLSDMMEYMMLKYDALFKKNKIKLQSELEKGCIVFANRMYLEQAVNNYMMNAFQHTAQGKWMRVGLFRKHGAVRIEIYNEGPRIPAEDMERIWQSFYKSGRGNYKKDLKLSNAGLGLYMVKKIVEQHGGRCGAENEENGVTFWMEFAAHQKSVANNRSFGKQHA